MNLQELKSKVFNLEKKYARIPNQVLNYYNDLLDTFYQYADSNNNTDYEFDEVFKDIVCGDDCIGLVVGATRNKLYYWKDDHGKTVVDVIDYKYLADLSNQALKYYDKNKDKDKELDIC